MEIVETVIAMSSKKSTTPIGEETESLISFCTKENFYSKELFFRSDKGNSHVYNIKTMKAGNGVCTSLLFTHAFSGVDTDSRTFSVRKAFIYVSRNQQQLFRLTKLFSNVLYSMQILNM